jgi:hypothetical protein
MYIDDYLILSDAQALTVSTNSTNVVDTLAAGHGHNDMVWAKFQVDTLFVGTAGTTVQLAIQASAAGSVFTTITSVDVALASLTAGAVPFVVKIPLGVYRYIRAYYTVTVSGSLSAGKIDCRLVKDVDVTEDRIL